MGNQGNVLLEKTYAFALRIVKLHDFLMQKSAHNQVIARQILKSGTSVGANAEEAVAGQSSKDFYAKLSISYKEARETDFWLRILRDTKKIEETVADSLLADCLEIQKIIGKTQSTVRKNNS